MATISPTEYAPDEAATYNFANLEPITLTPGETLDTDDPALVAAVNEHPWLSVEGVVEVVPADEPEADEVDEPEADDTFNRGFFAAGDDA